MKVTDLKPILQRQFGFNDFKAGQAVVLDSLLAQQNTLAVLPTGAGKTLIYQLYGIAKHCPVLIVSPLLSLMQDQINRMQAIGIKNAVAINSQLNWHQKQGVLNQLHRYQYIYVSPETLVQPAVFNRIRALSVGLVVIDEAHCLSQWGPDFRPEYLDLKSALNKLDNPLTLMLTATASQSIQTDIVEKLGLTNQVNVITKSVDRPNIYLATRTVADDDDKRTQLLHLIDRLKQPGIIYTETKAEADQLALWLQMVSSNRVAAYHGGLDAEDRFKIQRQFMDGQLDVICATNAFGMGVDKNNVRFVIHYQLPANLEGYMQEIGRAGRDGQPSIAVLFYRPGDEQIPKHLIDAGLPDQAQIQLVFQSLNKNPKNAQQLDLSAVERLLVYYWQRGVSIEQVTRLFEQRRYQKRNDLEMVLRFIHFKGCRRQFLLTYFDQPSPLHTNHCCDQGAHEALPLTQLKLIKDSNPSTPTIQDDWQLIIKKLFKIDDENQ